LFCCFPKTTLLDIKNEDGNERFECYGVRQSFLVPISGHHPEQGVPNVARLTQAIQWFVKMTNAVRLIGVDEADRLSHEYLFLESAIEESGGDIELAELEVVSGYDG
jgi:hypothetical protein